MNRIFIKILLFFIFNKKKRKKIYDNYCNHINLRKLLPSRLDIIVRILYAKYILNIEGYNDERYEKLFNRNILIRHSAIEPKSLINSNDFCEKNNLKDFQESYKNLIKSLYINAFNDNYKIPISNNNLINGAHRLSACIVLNIKPIFEENKKIKLKENNWNFEWYLKNGFDNEDLCLILKEYYKIFTKPISVGYFYNIYKNKKEKINYKNADKILNQILDSSPHVDDKIKFSKNIIAMYKQTGKQDFGRGEFYQSFEELGITGQRPTEKRFFIYELEKYIKNKNILDIGCNVGFFDIYCAKYCKNILGIEYNNSLIKIANAVKNYFNIENINFICEDFNKFFYNKKFDVIFSFAVHYWIGQNATEYSNKISNLLEKDGIVIIESQNIETIDKDFDKYIEEFIKDKFIILNSNYLCDDQIINRKFYVLQRI